MAVASILSKRGELNAAGVSDAIAEYWMGHSLGKVKGAYNVPPFSFNDKYTWKRIRESKFFRREETDGDA